MMKYPRAAMVHKFLFMMLVELAPYTRGTLDFLPLFNYNEVEYDTAKLKDLVDLAQHYMEKFK